MTQTKPADDEFIQYVEQHEFETISRQGALELVARIRTDAERIRQLEAELAKIRSGITAIDWLCEYDRANAAEARATRMAEALRFYAEGWPPGVVWDGGDHARAVLAELKRRVEIAEATALIDDPLPRMPISSQAAILKLTIAPTVKDESKDESP